MERSVLSPVHSLAARLIKSEAIYGWWLLGVTVYTVSYDFSEEQVPEGNGGKVHSNQAVTASRVGQGRECMVYCWRRTGASYRFSE